MHNIGFGSVSSLRYPIRRKWPDRSRYRSWVSDRCIPNYFLEKNYNVGGKKTWFFVFGIQVWWGVIRLKALSSFTVWRKMVRVIGTAERLWFSVWSKATAWGSSMDWDPMNHLHPKPWPLISALVSLQLTCSNLWKWKQVLDPGKLWKQTSII